MPAPMPSGSRPARRSQNRALAFAGGMMALGGLGWYLYTSWSASGAASGQPANRTARSDAADQGKKTGPPPSLSLSLPPTFSRSSANMRLLETLLTTLSRRYVVTLLAPAPRHASGSASASQPDQSADDQYALASVAQLSGALCHIPHFDARRVLEYSKEDGRLAVARALACDAHCEVMLQAWDGEEDDIDAGSGATSLFDNVDEHDDALSDGDRTPRAASPTRGMGLSPHTDADDERLVTALEQYHAQVARIRTSGGLLLFMILPVSRRSMQRAIAAASPSSTTKSDVWSLDVESVLKPFLMPGQRDLSARVPGVKIVDARPPVAPTAGPQQQQKAKQRAPRSTSPAPQNVASLSPTARAWTEAAQRIGHLADGWS